MGSESLLLTKAVRSSFDKYNFGNALKNGPYCFCECINKVNMSHE